MRKRHANFCYHLLALQILFIPSLIGDTLLLDHRLQELNDRSFTNFTIEQTPGKFIQYLNYTRNYCENPIKLGTHFNYVPSYQPYSQSSAGELWLTEKISGVVGEGAIVAFECLVANDNANAKFLVLRPLYPVIQDPALPFADTEEYVNALLGYKIICMAEAQGNAHYPHLKDFIPLEKPCNVEPGDMLAYVNENDLTTSRCNFWNNSNGIGRLNINSPLSYSSYTNGTVITLNTTDDLSQSNEVAPAFTALFECICEGELIGHPLNDRKNLQPENFVYLSSVEVPEQKYIKGVAIYTEYPGDDSITIEVEGCNEILRPSSSKVGVEEVVFSEPCFTGTSTRQVRVNGSALINGYSKNRIGFTETTEDFGETTNDFGVTSNRQYSVSAITICPKSLSDSNEIQLPQYIPDQSQVVNTFECIDDFTIRNLNWDLLNLHDEDLYGPHLYIDLKNSLKKGFLEQWNYHTSEAQEDDFFYPVIWRTVEGTESSNPEYVIVCSSFAENQNEGHFRHAYPSDHCYTQEGDYVGFIYNGGEKVPLSGTIVDEISADYLVVEDNTDFARFTPAEIGVPYSFKDANKSVRYNINAVICTVGFEPMFNDTFTYDDIQNNETNVTNLICPREYDESDAFILIDYLNPVPGEGFVVGFNNYLEHCNDNNPIMMIVRPNDEDGHDVICKRNVSGCPQNASDDHPSAYLDEKCAVKEGDLLAMAMMKSGQHQIPYHEVPDYPCKFVDIMFRHLPEVCIRKYSIGYIFQRACHVYSFGNRLVDRHKEIAIIPQNGMSVLPRFQYIDFTSQLDRGFVGSFEALIEGFNNEVLFYVLELNGATSIDDPRVVVVCNTSGINLQGEISIDAGSNCFIENHHKLALEIIEFNNSMGFECNQNFSSSTVLGSGGVFTDDAQNCMGNMQLSYRITMKCGSDLPLLVNKSYLNDEISLISHVDTTSGEYWRECDILIPQKIHGSTDITSAKEVKGKLIYADLTETLSEGYLVKWTIRIGSTASPVIPVIFRSTEDGSLRIVCKGYSAQSNYLYGDLEDIYPEELCSVKQGDFTGFISLANSGSLIRVVSNEWNFTGTNYSATPHGSVYEDFLFTNFTKNGVYSVYPLINEEIKFAIETTICLTLNDNEVCPGEKESSLNLSDYSFIGNDVGRVSYVDTSSHLPIGELISWRVKIADKTKDLHVVIWKKIDQITYEVKCNFYIDDLTYYDDEFDIKPETRCFVEDHDYYVGFISYDDSPALHYADTMGTKTMLYLPLDDSEFSIGSRTTFADLPDHPKIFDYINLRPKPEMVENRLYSISAKICLKGEICNGSTEITTSNSTYLALEYTLINTTNVICMTSAKILASQSGVVTLNFGGILSHTFDVPTGGYYYFSPNSSLCLPEDTYISIELDVLTPAPFDHAMNSTDLSEDQLINKFPIEICYYEEQVIGFHDLPRVRGKALNIMPLQENEMMLYFATSMVTRINNSQIRTFSAFLDKPGDITFVILKPEAGNSSYSVAEYETFTSSSSGPITFDISQSPVTGILEDHIFAVYCDPRIVSVTFVDGSERGRKLRIDPSVDDIFSPGYIIQVDRDVPVKPLIQTKLNKVYGQN